MKYKLKSFGYPVENSMEYQWKSIGNQVEFSMKYQWKLIENPVEIQQKFQLNINKIEIINRNSIGNPNGHNSIEITNEIQLSFQ